MNIIGTIIGITLGVLFVRIVLLGRYDRQNKDLLRNLNKFDEKYKDGKSRN